MRRLPPARFAELLECVQALNAGVLSRADVTLNARRLFGEGDGDLCDQLDVLMAELPRWTAPDELDE